ncbi:hypothetical protein AVEN_234068-1 [Araneus ventricosus]|uniref:Uncharacterized protein n=1 Tax=Araneus ventricosus TaxID=182803 RepID=A0A4Y2LNG9_ARAVE|nr:hypothetical protein AVEN_89878-1 [Araneus ventricosus]GBN15999.1 hypothetical protein AVEN_234068-1 [Araneus ventricosus]
MANLSAVTCFQTGAIAADVQFQKQKLPCKNLHRCNVISGIGCGEHPLEPELLACRFAHCLASVPPGRPGQSIGKPFFFVHNDISDVGYNT